MGLAKRTKNDLIFPDAGIESKKIGLVKGLLVICCLGFIPINTFPHGGFQVVDIFIVLLTIYYIFEGSKLDDVVQHHIFLLLPFVIWVQIVMISYSLFYKHISFILPAINILYAFFMLYTFGNMWIELLSTKDYKYIYIAFVIAIMCIFTFKPAKLSTSYRLAYSFNNPNQLALYSLLFISSIIVLIQQKIDNNNNNIIYYILDIFFILIGHYFIFMAITRAAVAAVVFLDICLMKKLFSKNMFLPVASILVAGVAVLMIFNPYFIQQRIEMRGSHRFTGSAFEERVEEAIAEPMKDLKGFKILFGTGQIPAAKLYGQDRIKAGLGERGIEVHNMFGNVLWSYGVIGLILYAFWIGKTIWEVRIVPNTLFIWAAILTFSIGGVVIRVRSYWLVVGLMMALWSLKIADDKKTSPEVTIQGKSGRVS